VQDQGETGLVLVRWAEAREATRIVNAGRRQWEDNLIRLRTGP